MNKNGISFSLLLFLENCRHPGTSTSTANFRDTKQINIFCIVHSEENNSLMANGCMDFPHTSMQTC